MDSNKIYGLAFNYLKLAEGKKIFYYIGKRPASPKPTMVDRIRPKNIEYKSGDEIVWLSDDYESVYAKHGIRGNLYIYEISNKIIKDSGGIYRYDLAREVIIPKEIWEKGISNGDIKLIGSKDKQKLDKLMEDRIAKDNSFYAISKPENLDDVLKRINKNEQSKNLDYLALSRLYNIVETNAFKFVGKDKLNTLISYIRSRELSHNDLGLSNLNKIDLIKNLEIFKQLINNHNIQEE